MVDTGEVLTSEYISACGCGAFDVSGHRLEHEHGTQVTGMYGAVYSCTKCEKKLTVNLMSLMFKGKEYWNQAELGHCNG
jgi:hypothetical protein